MIWMTGDWHLNHANIMKYCNRPFLSVDKMDHTIIENFFGTVNEKDTVYFLGDLIFGEFAGFFSKFGPMLKKMNAHFIIGNHDSHMGMAPITCFRSMKDINTININGQTIVLCHYAMRTWRNSCHGSWQLFGHSHGTLKPVGKQLDVGVDCWNFKPVSIDQIRERMDLQGNSEDYVKEGYETV